MTKYDPLRRFLVRRRREDVRMTLDEIERVIGGMLPKAATRPEWWCNDPPADRRGYVQCKAWLDAGYVAQTARPAAGIVFCPAASHAQTASSTASIR